MLMVHWSRRITVNYLWVWKVTSDLLQFVVEKPDGELRDFEKKQDEMVSELADKFDLKSLTRKK